MLIQRTLSYLPAQIMGPAVQFVAILAFTHVMSPDAYGIFTYVMASQDFVFLLSVSWWSQYTVRYLGEHTARADERYRRSEVPILLGTIVLQAASALLSLLFITEAISATLAAATVLYMVSRCVTLHLGERARAENRILDYTLAQSVGPLVGFAVAWIAIDVYGPKPDVALAGYGVAQTVVLVWLIARQDLSFALRGPDRALVLKALTFGVPLLAAGLAAWVSMNGIRVLLDHTIGAAAMGLIAVGWALGHRLTSTAAMLVTVAAYPLAVETLRAGSRKLAFAQITTNGLLMLGLVLPAVVGLYLLEGPLVDVLVAAPFREMTLAVLPAALAAGLFRNIRTHVADQIFLLVARTGIVFAMAVMETVLVMLGCVAGLYFGGSAGAAYGAAGGYGLAMIVSFIVARVVAGLVLPLRGAGLVALAVAAMALVLHALPPTQAIAAPPLLVVLGKVVAGACVYLACVLALFPSIARRAWTRWRQPALRESDQPPRSWKKS